MRVIKTANMRIPVFSWCENPEDGAIAQAENLAKLPFVFKHVALMPDTHQGYGMPIGGVIACKGVVIPNAVGVDIGCGMLAIKTDLTEISTERLKDILTLIRKKIPVGFNSHSKAQELELMPVGEFGMLICQQEYNKALRQLGTLGGGNHFIEIQKGSDGCIWFMVHSGSRHLGYTVAKNYNNLAQSMCKKWHSNIPPFKGEDGLAFLPIDSDDGRKYIREMQFCLEYAQANRELMAERIKEAFIQDPCVTCKGDGGFKGKKCAHCGGYGYFKTEKKVKFENAINIHHNYAAIENHFGQNLWVHRKGATSAREGQFGIVPGSQGTCSYIVSGKGNEKSFMSCSHGAGRKMSRTKAIKELDLKKEQEKLRGIIHSVRGSSNLDEASGAYKDINIVMNEQKDLIDIVVELKPLAVIKG